MLTSEAVQPFTVLHLGCGRKKTLEALGLKLAMNGQPLDPSRVRMINLDRLTDVEPDVLCELSTDRIDLPDNSVDAVYLNQEAYASPGSAIPDYRPNFDFVLVQHENIPDHTNPENTEPVAFIRGTLVARKPLVPYWEPVL
jgi:hypothetical protein